MNNTFETLWRTHESIHSWIHSTNTKAEIILGVNGIITSVFLTSDLEALKTYITGHPLIYIPLMLSTLSTIASIIYSILCINPRLEVGAPQSLIYFSHIAQRFSHAPSYENAIRESLIDDNELLHDLASQVWANAKVATAKFYYVTWAIRALVVTIILGILTVVLALVFP